MELSLANLEDLKWPDTNLTLTVTMDACPTDVVGILDCCCQRSHWDVGIILVATSQLIISGK